MIPGGQHTFVLKSATEGAQDRKGIAVITYVETSMLNCLLQPIDVKEDVTNIDYTIGRWMITAEPYQNAITSKPTDLLYGPTNVYNLEPMTLRVYGTKVFPGPNGLPHHVVFYAETPSGLNE